MLRNILVALDTSSGSLSAQYLALKLAKQYKTPLTGIGIVDQPWIEVPEAIPLGGVGFKITLDKELFAQAKQQVHGLERSFQNLCESEGVTCSVIDSTGVPSDEIEHFLVEYDLLVIGKDASFHFSPSPPPTPSVKQLIKDNLRPLIVTGETLPWQDNPEVLIAFDGSFAASRSLHMAFLTGLLEKKIPHIVTIGPDQKAVQKSAEAAARFCGSHGLAPQLHPLISSDDPSQELLKMIEKICPSLLVLGAYSRGELSHFFWGSCAEELLEATDVPTFFFH